MQPRNLRGLSGGGGDAFGYRVGQSDRLVHGAHGQYLRATGVGRLRVGMPGDPCPWQHRTYPVP